MALARWRLGVRIGITLGMAFALLAGVWGLQGLGVTAQNAPTVQTHTAGNLGTVLAGSDGKTLYVFDQDTAGSSACNGGCATTWPPLTLAAGNPVAPAGVGGTFGTITRSDGTRQVTYNDHPLYFFSADAQPGDAKGDGVGGVWHAAKPIAAAAAPASPAAASAAPSSAGSVRAMPNTGSGGQAGAADRRLPLAMMVVLGAGLLGAVGVAAARRAAGD
ncbi:MAG TPA: hypothetical protein VFD32_11595 [Dehalococcoidia bacterium]|nr:hypothetical protein [Dehalococcoidia bacterium]